MPQFDLQVLGSSTPRVGSSSLDLAAERLAPQLSKLGMQAMNRVADGRLVISEDPGWPVRGSYLEPKFSAGVSPLIVTMTMNPFYRNFNFGGLRAVLHGAFRQNVWSALCMAGAEEYVDFGGPSGAHVLGRFAFTVRVVCGLAAGSDVTEEGRVVGEYGGPTGVVQLELPA